MEKAAGGVLVPRLTFGLIDLAFFAASALTYFVVGSARQRTCGLVRGEGRLGALGLGRVK